MITQQPSLLKLTRSDASVHVTIRLIGADWYPADVISNILNEVNSAIIRSEEDCIQRARLEASPVARVVLESVLVQHRESGQAGLAITEAKTGSIIVSGIAIGLAKVLFDRTIGTTLGEVWKDSDEHRNLKALLTLSVSELAESFRRRVRGGRRHLRLPPAHRPARKHEVIISENEKTEVIEITLDFSDDQRTGGEQSTSRAPGSSSAKSGSRE